MQSSEYRPQEEGKRPDDNAEAELRDPQFFEFPADVLAQEAAPKEASGAAQEQPSESDLVYPPLPSFYQAMPSLPAQRQPLPPRGEPVANMPPAAFPYDNAGPGTWGSAYSLRGQAPPQAPPYPPYPPFMPPPAAKRSTKWIWIVVSIMAVVLFASCGLCAWGYSGILSSAMQGITQSTSVVNDYYNAIQTKDYGQAYHDLAPQGSIAGLTQDQFTQQAMARDAQYGAVASYVPAQPSFDINNQGTGVTPSSYFIVVKVTRPSLTYNALLTVHDVGGSWKIIDYDRI